MSEIIKNKIIKDEEGVSHYFDNNGEELQDGDMVSIAGSQPKKLYLTEDMELGTDATNPLWIKSGKAAPCEYGVYPLTRGDMKDIVKEG